MKLLRASQGFTLLEVMIAMMIMVVAFASILGVQSSTMLTTERARRMNIVAMLARNAMIQTELEIAGKQFTEVKEEEAGQFESPYQDYSWKRTIKEVKFPDLNLGAAGGEDKKDSGDSGGDTGLLETFNKLITQFFSKALREVTITVEWKRGSTPQSFSVATFWVDLNHEFALSQ